jgi:hypothetical protein
MAKLFMIYDYHEDNIKPFSVVIRFAEGELDWTRSVVYIPMDFPFRRLLAEDLEDSGYLGISVLLEDLVTNPKHQGCVGIHLNSIARRHLGVLPALQDEVQLIVRMCDIEEVMEGNRD